MTYKTQLKKRVLAGLLAGTALWLGMPAALAASGVVPNTQLPQGGHFINGGINDVIGNAVNGQMTITQESQNAVIQWDKGFNVGANATVNFKGPESGYNTLNYDASGNMSQIYGAINANNNGNIYIVNPAGVEISSSAQINVGSLYVSNKKMETKDFTDFQSNAGGADFVLGGTTTDAALMSLGNINADHVTFEGRRIVIDTERLKSGDNKMTAENINVRTTDAGQVVLGYDAYDADNKTYAGANNNTDALATVNGTELKKANGYMWVEDIEQLQAVNTNLSGQYALRNSIDATATKDWADGGFKPIIGKDDGNDIAFTGKFDGLDYNIFNLNINRNTENNVGLFGVVGGTAVIQNVTLVGGSIKGQNNVGALAGQVSGGAQISNSINSASVTGSSSVGGLIGSAGNSVFENLVNTGTVAGTAEGAENNAGGLIGSLTGGTLSGTSYNLGGVTGKGSNVGGLVGKASDATLGDGMNLIYNRLNVSGAYNVGGIVGSMANTTVKNAENSGNVTATGHTTETYKYHSAKWTSQDSIRKETVNIANAGGIAGTASGGSKISDVQNSGDVSSGIDTKDNGGYTFYTAGNVGGIVGRAENTNITDATNTENDVRGAHNVGGIAGYFGSKDTENTDVTYTITRGVNNGGDILATGAVDKDTKESTTSNELTRKDGFITEYVRGGSQGSEQSIIGNIGGIAGYMYGDNVYIASSANRGTVHSQDISTEKVLPVNQAANAGGIVGKIDRSHTIGKDDATGIIDTEKIKDKLGTNYEKAAVSNSYNTGDVRGYMGVGGVAGMMYNGEIAGSYNLGTVNTTRNQDSFNQGNYFAVNMGGIVGDTTEETDARAVLYDVYNKGQIGDENFKYYARHVGGVVGRLSGAVEKAYNTGAIYNGYSIVGGIVGWLNAGSVTNSFNTGNITVWNHDGAEASNVGGIAGDVNIATGDIVLTNVYNLGTLRSIKFTGGSLLGGIVGAIHSYHDSKTGKLLISNAYTTGNLYSDGTLGSILGEYRDYQTRYHLTNTYYIKPDPALIDATQQAYFKTLEKDTSQDQRDNSNAAIDFGNKDDIDQYKFDNRITNPSKDQSGNDIRGENVDEDAAWRIYAGSTPILNAFLPNTEDYFSSENGKINADGLNNISSIQYGTAYDPLLTIIHANTDTLKFDWQALGANNAAGIAVYGAGLTLNNFKATGGSGYFGGMIYSDGALSIESENNGDVALGSASQLYGSSVSISADGNVTIYGNVTATGNGTNAENNPVTDNSGSISITGGSVDVYGQLTSAKNAEKENTTFIPGIGSMASDWKPGTVSDHTEPMTDIGDRFGYTTGASAVNGNISITANETASEDGHVNVYYGHQQKGFLDTAGNLTVSGSGDVYMDSDLSIGGSLSITAGADSEAVLDISNIGQVQAANDASQAANVSSAVSYLHKFLDHFSGDNGSVITLSGGKQKIAVDMWTDNAFDLNKFDLKDASGTVTASLADKLNGLNINGSTQQGQEYTYIWVSTGEELKNIQTYYDTNKNSTKILSYNFALKNDIDASAVTGYEAIGTGNTDGFTGTFDGRDNRIIGLKVDTLSDGTAQSNVGIFNTVGEGGKVEDLRVYSGTFSGTDNAGAVAGINKGTISNVTTFGNVVIAKGSNNSTEMPGDEADTTVKVGAAGGIAGINAGIIDNASASDAVTAADAKDADILSTAGGIAGINQNKISNSSSNSAVNASAGSTYALGGVAGVNGGELSNVDSLGVTTGIYEVGSHNTAIGTQYSDNVGGIAGRNSGTVSEAYNESIVSGRDNVGGILGVNTAVAAEGKESPVQNVSNAARVTGEAASNDTSDYVGGLVGSNSGSITNGRNNGKITGSQYVGGLVGENGKDSTLSNLVNDEAASITGDNYVGGIAGSNAGYISSQNQKNLVNRGSITGQMYVGGVAGENIGTIEYVKSDIDLNVRDTSAEAKYFGGVAGINGEEGGSKGTITNATNSANVIAINADYVGGIVGWNTVNGVLSGAGNSNEGRVEGNSYVGGVAGRNDAAITGELNSMIGIKNSGVVIAHKGGAGGIFGENKGDITYVEMINNGIVTGTDGEGTGLNGTGGIFGVNSGTVTYSSLKNQVDGQVIGTQNVGGLIGVNTGTITGGRDEKDGYYKYQIYNNGTIQVGTWTDSDRDGIIDTNEFTAAAGENIGGLFGTNKADVTAAYNTGAIMAGSSTNVGGIAGYNTGKLDQVFNTVMTADGTNQTITGGTNVGGIVGSNEINGTVSNAYNTTGVIGKAENAVVGAIAGTNSGTISNIYATVSGGLVGKNDSGTIEHNYDASTSDTDWEEVESYEGFDFTGKNGNSAVWKIYEGSTNPLLKVFLTKVTIDSGTDLGLVYNGSDQDIPLDQFVAHTGVSAGDGFNAYQNSNSLIQNTDFEHKNAGEYSNWLYSIQIAASTDETTGFNPNNLGYDIDFTQSIDKAVITVTGNIVDRTYGSAAITSSTDGTGVLIGGKGNYGFTVTAENTGITEAMKEELTDSNLGFDNTKIFDGALSTESGKTTESVSDGYTWSTGLKLNADLEKNYTFRNGTDSTEITVAGQSHINKADLTIIADPETIYVGGTPNYTGTVDHFVNGDQFTVDFGVKDPSIESTVDTHTDAIGFWFGGQFYLTSGWENLFGGNYNIKFTPGTLTVKDLPSGVPDIPDKERWNSLLRDAPWDRNRNFRERKAEVHFLAGGMTL